MKKTAFYLLGYILLLPGLVFGAGVHTIHVEWSYSGSAITYILYQDGVQVCASADVVSMQMDCDVFLSGSPSIFTLTAIDLQGDESPQSAPYTLVPPSVDEFGNYIPQPDIQVTNSAGDIPFTVSFDASASSDLGGVITDFNWDFGDGETASGELFDHTFVAPGMYTVTLSVIDDGGASADTTITITATDPTAGGGGDPALANDPPVASLTATPLVSGTSRIAFDAYGSTDSDGSIVSYSWDFGDGDTGSGEYVEHEFIAAGDYTVVLTVVDDEGAAGQDQMTITMVDQAAPNVKPVAEVSVSIEERLIQLDWDYPAGDADLAGFRLYQNDRMVCEIADPGARQSDCYTHIDNGTVQLWMTAYDQFGVETTISEVFTFDSTGIYSSAAEDDAPLLVYMSAGSSYDEDGKIASYSWDFGDGSIGEGPAVYHIYDFPGTYTATLTITDDAGETAQASTSISVTGTVNLAPIASGDAFSTDQNKSHTRTLSAVDPEGQSLTYSLESSGTSGTATITNTSSGIFTYVPNSGAVGNDSFTFKVNDGELDSNTATVSVVIIPVNNPPSANSVQLNTDENTAASGTLTGSDPDGDTVAYIIKTNPVNGSVVLSSASTGAFTYTPAADFSGTDEFTFAISDGSVESSPAVVRITIAPVNDSPAAIADTATTLEDTTVTIAVLANDTDVDGDSLSLASVGQADHGAVSISGNSATYTPASNYSGSDSFTYTVDDGQGGTDRGSVTLTVSAVNDLPVASIEAGAVFASGDRLVHVEWDYTATPGLAGFRLYYDSSLACEVSDSAARQMDCLVTVSGATGTISLTSFDTSGVESSPISVTADVGSSLQPGILSGTPPLTQTYMDTPNKSRINSS
ncbi:MAG: tandem-95 repeat protein [Candidatus Thiodiazotropha sp. (ex Epidulcina cf. delphinae)]|nr:tandem-95 repeat protein [Candidatus Thiodiazotropha sp. (ex Epidulcina cf. delphinae)]